MALTLIVDNDQDPNDVIEPVPLTLPLDRKSLSWLSSMASSDEERAEIIASMVRMIVDDDEAAHGETQH